MKIKTTRNALTALGLPIITIPYCGCQTLVKFQEPIAYNAGTYGWNYDVYKINNTLLVTGRTMPISGSPLNILMNLKKERNESITAIKNLINENQMSIRC